MAESAISIISSLPIFISEEEHRTRTSSTPESFADIPPVLKHQQRDVTVKFDPPIQELSPDELKGGTLYVVESLMIYMASSGSKGFTIAYPNITLHAISRSESGPSVYCQIDPSPGDNGEVNQSDEDVVEMIELTLVPTETSSVETIFEALSICASLHPDPGADEDADEDAFIDSNNGEFEVFNGTEDQELSEVGRAALAHLESIIQYPEGHRANGTEHPTESEEEQQ